MEEDAILLNIFFFFFSPQNSNDMNTTCEIPVTYFI